MIARSILIGVMALPGWQTSPPALQTRTLLRAGPLSDEISMLSVNETPADIGVRVDGGWWRDDEMIQRAVSGMTIQVWLLSTDGRALAQKAKPINVQYAGSLFDSMIFSFEHVPTNELAGIVLGVNGKLYVREIKSNQVR
jgi:hypothetical protein